MNISGIINTGYQTANEINNRSISTSVVNGEIALKMLEELKNQQYGFMDKSLSKIDFTL